jgi:hypothetical protein
MIEWELVFQVGAGLTLVWLLSLVLQPPRPARPIRVVSALRRSRITWLAPHNQRRSKDG